MLVLMLGWFVLYLLIKTREKIKQLEGLKQKNLEISNIQLDNATKKTKLLLKEIPPRVKNTWIVFSLLELQSAQIDVPFCPAAMLAQPNRVHSMGIHTPKNSKQRNTWLA